jgi:hypothetical protein
MWLSMAQKTTAGGELGGRPIVHDRAAPNNVSESTRVRVPCIEGRALIWRLLLFFAAACRAELTVWSGSTPPLTVASSQFVRFASLGADSTLVAPGVVLSKDVCRPKAAVVQGKIVILPWVNSWKDGADACTLTEVYWRLAAAGARAYITIPVTPHSRPGRWCYRFDSWKHLAMLEKDQGRAPILAEIPRFDSRRHDGIIAEWATAGRDGTLQVAIGPPFDTFFRDHYASWAWVLFFRVLPPLFSFFVTITAASVVVNERLLRLSPGEWSVGAVICVFEGFAALIVGLALATGLYGPMVFPFTFYISLSTLVGGFAITSEVLLLLFMHESTRAIALRYRRRNVWSLHRWKLIVFFVANNLLDMVFPIDFMDRSASYLSLASWIFGALTFFAISLVYSVRSHQYALPLRQHMRAVVRNPNEAKIRSLVFYLRLSSVCVGVASVMRVVILFLWRFGIVVARDILLSLGVWSRIIGSYALIRAIAPAMPPAEAFAKISKALALFFRPSAAVDIAVAPSSATSGRKSSLKSSLTSSRNSRRSSASWQSTLASIEECKNSTSEDPEDDPDGQQIA